MENFINLLNNADKNGQIISTPKLEKLNGP